MHQRPPFKLAALLSMCFFLSSCDQEDRIAWITCTETPGDPTSVLTEFVSQDRKHVSSVGYLNTWGLNLGDIVKMEPESFPGALMTKLGVSTLSTKDTLNPPPLLLLITIGEKFKVHFADDRSESKSEDRPELTAEILKHTMLGADNLKVNSVINPENLINRDVKAVERYRATKGGRLAIVSETVDSEGLTLFSTITPSIAANTLEINGSYIHLSYACSAIDLLRKRAQKANGRVPMIIYLTPITYDERSGKFMPAPLSTTFYRRY